MKVIDLQQHLADLGKLLRASGAKKVADDLAAIEEGLTPFLDLELRGFADFLRRAEGYSRGEVPITPSKSKTAQPRKTASYDVGILAAEIADLYERVVDPAITQDAIEKKIEEIAPLKKPELVIVSEALGLKGMKSKTKGDIIKEIRQRLVSRKGDTQRAQLIH